MPQIGPDIHELLQPTPTEVLRTIGGLADSATLALASKALGGDSDALLKLRILAETDREALDWIGRIAAECGGEFLDVLADFARSGNADALEWIAYAAVRGGLPAVELLGGMIRPHERNDRATLCLGTVASLAPAPGARRATEILSATVWSPVGRQALACAAYAGRTAACDTIAQTGTYESYATLQMVGMHGRLHALHILRDKARAGDTDALRALEAGAAFGDEAAEKLLGELSHDLPAASRSMERLASVKARCASRISDMDARWGAFQMRPSLAVLEDVARAIAEGDRLTTLWLSRKAETAGTDWIRVVLADRLLSPDNPEHDEGRAFTLLRLASENGDAPASMILARMLESGLAPCGRDTARAMSLYMKCAEEGDCEALDSFIRLYDGFLGRASSSDTPLPLDTIIVKHLSLSSGGLLNIIDRAPESESACRALLALARSGNAEATASLDGLMAAGSLGDAPLNALARAGFQPAIQALELREKTRAQDTRMGMDAWQKGTPGDLGYGMANDCNAFGILTEAADIPETAPEGTGALETALPPMGEGRPSGRSAARGAAEQQSSFTELFLTNHSSRCKEPRKEEADEDLGEGGKTLLEATSQAPAASRMPLRVGAARAQVSGISETVRMHLDLARRENGSMSVTAYRSILQLAKTGMADAAYAAGMCLCNGWGCRRSEKLGLRHLLAATTAGIAEAQCEYAVRLERRGETEEAASWFAKAAGQGLYRATGHLAAILDAKGEDPRRVAGLYEQAASSGDPLGQSGYASCLYAGRGADMDRPRALELYRSALRQDAPLAAAGLAAAAEDGDEEAFSVLCTVVLETGCPSGMEYFLKIAQGDRLSPPAPCTPDEALSLLCRTVADEHVVYPKEVEAMRGKLFSHLRAIASKDAVMMERMGVLAYAGDRKAASWLRLHRSVGCAGLFYARCLIDGRGLVQDEDLGIATLLAAGNRDAASAIPVILSILSRGDATSFSLAEALNTPAQAHLMRQVLLASEGDRKALDMLSGVHARPLSSKSVAVREEEERRSHTPPPRAEKAALARQATPPSQGTHEQRPSATIDTETVRKPRPDARKKPPRHTSAPHAEEDSAQSDTPPDKTAGVLSPQRGKTRQAGTKIGRSRPVLSAATLLMLAEEGNVHAGAELKERAEEDDTFRIAYATARINGWGVRKAPKEGADVIVKLYESGCATARCAYALCHSEGIGSRGDVKLALSILQELSDQGDARAQLELSNLYFLGRGVMKNDAMVLHLLEKAMRQDYAPAYHRLAQLTWHGVLKSMTTPSPQRAVELYMAAANLGYTPSMIAMAECLESGTGCRQSRTKSMTWYRRALEMDDPRAARNLSSLVVRRGREDALTLLGALARKDIPSACEGLAEIVLASACGKAFDLLREASGKSRHAKREYDRLTVDLSGKDLDRLATLASRKNKDITFLLQEAAQAGSTLAAKSLKELS